MYEILENTTEHLIVKNGKRLISIREDSDYEGNWFLITQAVMIKPKMFSNQATVGEKFTFMEGEDRFDIYKQLKQGTIEWFQSPPERIRKEGN